jgi:hypothetical protein
VKEFILKTKIKTDIIPDHLRKSILSEFSSRQNKLWMVTAWQHFRPFYIEWKWAGEAFKSRMLFQFQPNGPWVEAKSFEEDVLPRYKFGKEKNK